MSALNATARIEYREAVAAHGIRAGFMYLLLDGPQVGIRYCADPDDTTIIRQRGLAVGDTVAVTYHPEGQHARIAPKPTPEPTEPTGILDDVLAAMQNAEEAGGPEGAEYIGLMQSIIAEAQKRIDAYRRNTRTRVRGSTIKVRDTVEITVEMRPPRTGELGFAVSKDATPESALAEVIRDRDTVDAGEWGYGWRADCDHPEYSTHADETDYRNVTLYVRDVKHTEKVGDPVPVPCDASGRVFRVGARVRSIEVCDRFPHFQFQPGVTGTVDTVERDVVYILADQPWAREIPDEGDGLALIAVGNDGAGSLRTEDYPAIGDEWEVVP